LTCTEDRKIKKNTTKIPNNKPIQLKMPNNFFNTSLKINIQQITVQQQITKIVLQYSINT
jgi:hypothetical protein